VAEIFLNRVGEQAAGNPVVRLVYDTNFFNELLGKALAFTAHRLFNPGAPPLGVIWHLASYVIEYNHWFYKGYSIALKTMGSRSKSPLGGIRERP
jgi:hypothetical protein